MIKMAWAVGIVLVAGTATAADLVVVGGELRGANGVNVNGTLYDAEFVDGTCSDLFNGCDALEDFTFRDEASAEAASLALTSQVFLNGPSGNFNSDPTLTRGCEQSAWCRPLTPFAIPGPTQLRVFSNPNFGGQLTGSSMVTLKNDYMDTTTSDAEVYVRWQASPPEPVPMSSAPVMLLMVALLAATGLGTFRRR